MKRTALSALAVVIGMSLVAPAASAAPTPPVSPALSGATVLLEGELVLVEDAYRGEGPRTSDDDPREDVAQALLEVDGRTVPIAPSSVTGLESGAVLTVEVAVPDVVADAVAQGERVSVERPADGGDEVVIPSSALEAAQDEPAGTGSDLAAATAVAAGSGAEPVAVSVMDVAPAAAPPTSQAPHEITIAVVGVNGRTDPRYTDAEVSRLVAEASRYWSDQTEGAVTFRGGAATRYTSSIACKNYSDLWNEAKGSTGFVSGANRHLVLMLPRSAYDMGACGYGLGSVGSAVSTGGVSSMADVSWPVLAHELGHNMSLQHANRLECGTSADSEQIPPNPSGACSVEEYGDLADVMSSSNLNAAGGLGAVGLRRLGLLTVGDQQALTARGVTALTLAPLGAGSGLRVATVTDPRNGVTYHLENRQAVGRDVYGFGGLGVYESRSNPGGATLGLRVLRRSDTGASLLLDPTPTSCAPSCSRDADVVIAPGSTFRSVADGVEIRSRQTPDGSVIANVSVAAAGQQHWSDPASVGEATAITVAAVKPRATAVTTLPVTVTAGTVMAPSGTVTVNAGDVVLGRGNVSRGKASVRLPVMSRGRQDLVVAYEPAAAGIGTPLAGARSALVLDVLGAPSRVTTTLALRSVTIADTPSVTVSVSAVGATPTGAVTVTESGETLGTGVLVKGRATVALPPLAIGKHDLVAVYDGDERVDPRRSAAVVQAVTPLPVSSITATVTRVTTAQQAKVIATVRAAGRAASGGARVVRDGETLVSGQLVNGRAALVLPALPAGRHELSIVHEGSATVTGSTRALTVVVAPAKSSITAVLGLPAVTQSSTATIAVNVGAPGLRAAGGVRLLRARTVLGEAEVVDGWAELTVPADLPVGRQSLTVAYGGSTELLAGSVTLPVTVVR